MGLGTISAQSRRFLIALAVIVLSLAGLAAAPTAHAAASGTAAMTLRQAFDNVGITTASDASAGDYDGIGDSFDASRLAADALSPGKSLLHDGLSITWPNVAPGQPDNVVADGQAITLSGSGTTLGVVGASAFGTTAGTFTVHYGNGTSSSQTVSFGDWINQSAASGTDTLAT